MNQKVETPLLCITMLVLALSEPYWSRTQNEVEGSLEIANPAIQAQSSSALVGSEIKAATAKIDHLIDAGRLQEAREELMREIATRGEDPKTLLLEAKILFRGRQFQESLEKLERIVPLGSRDSEVFKLAASNAILLDRLDVAELNLKTAIQLSPHDVVAHLQLGMLYFVNSRFALAERQLRQAVKLKPNFMRGHVILGLTLEELGEEKAAIQSYQEAVQLTNRQNLSDESAYFHSGRFLLARNRYQESLTFLQKAVQLNPKSSEASCLLGKVLYELGNVAEAMSRMSQAAKNDPSNPEPHYLLSRIYLKQGKQDEAQKELQAFQVLEQTAKETKKKKDLLTQNGPFSIPQSSSETGFSLDQIAKPRLSVTADSKSRLASSLTKAANVPEVADASKTAVAVEPDNAGALYRLGLELMRQGEAKNGDAMGHFLEVLRLQPTHVGARVSLSDLLQQGGDVDGALGQLQEAIRLAPQKADLWLLMGTRQYAARKYPEAIPSLRKAIELNPQLPHAHYELGLALVKLNRFPEAEEEFTSALRLNPRDAHTRYELGKLNRRGDKLTEAIAHLEAAVQIKPDMSEAHAELGSCYRRQNRIDDAEKAFRTAVGLNPKLERALYSLARLLQARGEIEQAKLYLQQVQQLKQNSTQAVSANRLNEDGMQLMNEGHLNEALNAFKRALEIDPSFATAAYNQGVVLARQRKTQEAIEAFRAAIRLRPSFVMARYGLAIMFKATGNPLADEELRKTHLLNEILSQPSVKNGLTATSSPTEFY